MSIMKAKGYGLVAVGILLTVIGTALVAVSRPQAVPILAIGAGVTLVGLVLLALDVFSRKRRGR